MKTIITVLLCCLSLTFCQLCYDTAVSGHTQCGSSPWENTNCSSINGVIYCDKSCRKIQVPGSEHEVVSCQKVNGKSLVCETECLGLGGSHKCSGTPQYCSEYTCKISSDCFCDFHKYNTQFECDILGEWELASTVQLKFSIKEPTFEPFMGNSNPWTMGPARRSVNRNVGVTISFVTPYIVVGTQFPEWTNILTTKDGLSNMNNCTNMTRCDVLLGPRYFINPGKVKVVVFYNDTLQMEKEFDIGIQTRCEVPNCVFCSSMYYDFVCYPPMFKVFLITLLVAAFLAILIMIGFVVKLIWKYSLLGKLFRCCKECKNRRRNKRENDEEAGFTEYTEEEIQSAEDYTSRTKKNKKNAGRNVQLFAIALLFTFAIPGLLPLVDAAPCAQGITISSEASQCLYDGDIETCTIHVNSLLSIPGPGLSSCLTILDDKEEVLATVEISFERMIERAPLQVLYYTAPWGGASMSERNCPWEYMCGDSLNPGGCSSYNPVNDPSAQGLIPSWIMAYQGTSRCDSQCGCAGCGCFSCAASCVYSRGAIIPFAGIVEVARPISIHRSPVIKVTITTDSTSNTEEKEGKNEDIVILTNFTLRVEGSLSGSTTIFGAEKITTSAFDSRMGTASEVNAPVVGSLGDIQANNPASLGPWGQYKLAAGLFTANPTSASTNYAFAGSGWHVRSVHDILPTTRGTTTWTKSGATLVGLNTDPGALLLTLQTPQGFSVQRRVNVVCPEVTKAVLSGCLSCDQSATLTITARSTCAEGMALVTATGTLTILTTSITLTDAPKEFNIRVHSAERENSGTLTLTSGPHSASIDYSGNLYPEELVVIVNGTFDVNNDPDASGGVDISDWFSDLPNVWQIILGVLGAIVAVAVAIVAIILIVKLVRFIKSNKVKYEKLEDEETIDMEAIDQKDYPKRTFFEKLKGGIKKI
jgi:hypothetical protein